MDRTPKKDKKRDNFQVHHKLEIVNVVSNDLSCSLAHQNDNSTITFLSKTCPDQEEGQMLTKEHYKEMPMLA